MIGTGLVLAIEAGGSKTDAVLAAAAGAEAPRLARVRAGPGNLQRLGRAGAAALLRDVATRLLAEAGGRSLPELSVVSVAMAGVESEADAATLRAALLDAGIEARAVINSDARATLHGACGSPGVLVIAGTGSIAFGRNSGGTERRAGGWGYAFGDEGSAYDLGRRALSYAVRTLDGRQPRCKMVECLLEALGAPAGASTRPTIVALIGKIDAVAALAPVVLEAARAGDLVARGIADSGARGLLDMVTAVAQGLELGGQPFEVALYGGLLLNGISYTERLQQMIRLRFATARAALAPPDAGLRGALMLAAEPAREVHG